MDLFQLWDSGKQESPQCSIHICGERRNTGLSQVHVPQAAGENTSECSAEGPALSWSCSGLGGASIRETVVSGKL